MARGAFSDLLKKTKRDHWEDWLENVDGKTIWDAHKFTSGAETDGGRVRIPALKKTVLQGGGETIVQENEGKSWLLHEAFSSHCQLRQG